MSTVLITGGAGFIGSHVAQTFLATGHDVIIADNRRNHLESSNNVKLLREFESEFSGKVIADYETSIFDFEGLLDIFTSHEIDLVIHCAALKSVSESMTHPLRYLQTNVTGTALLLVAMKVHEVNRMIFASSAGIYGGNRSYFQETDDRENADHTYGKTKRICETLIHNAIEKGTLIDGAILRITNPVDLISPHHFEEDVTGEVSNLLPVIRRCAKENKVFQMRLTPNGFTARRDYIAVQDVAHAFKSANMYLEEHSGCHIWDVSSGGQCTTSEMFNYIKERYNYQIEVSEVAAGDFERDSLALDNSKMIRDFNFTPMDIRKLIRRA